MISSLADGVLLLALTGTSCVVGATYRELRRQAGYRLAYERLLSQTAETLAAIDLRIGHINAQSGEVLKSLAERTAESRALIAEMERLHGPAESRLLRTGAASVAARGRAEHDLRPGPISLLRKGMN